MSTVAKPPATLEIQMLRLASCPVAAPAIYVLAALGIPDILRDGSKIAGEIAKAAQAHCAILQRVLRFLATIDLLRKDCQGQFSLTPLGKTLCSRPISTIRDNTLLMGSNYYWAAIGAMLHQVKTGDNAFKAGDNAFQYVMGQKFFACLADHPDDANVFDAAMNSSSRIGVASILTMYDFSSLHQVVDIAGEKGALLTGVLHENPSVHGVLFDSPSVIDQVSVDPALAGRFCKISGNFFEYVPTGGDVYILHRILRDWDDERAAAILRRCRKAIVKDGKLLIIELAAPAAGESASDWATNDMLMMLLLNGRERSETDFYELLGAAGFQLQRVVRGNSPYWIIEAFPA